MRPVLTPFLGVLTVGVLLSGCSAVSSLHGGRTTPSMPAPTAPLPSSRVFGTPFPVAGDAGTATVTLSDLRIVRSYVHDDSVVVVDVRAVQAAGRPVVDPALLHAFDPGGRELDRIAYPKGTVDDPLVRGELVAPGQEVRGMVAWTMPKGGRIGRVDYVDGGSVNSLTVPRQPVDPEATPATAATAATPTG